MFTVHTVFSVKAGAVFTVSLTAVFWSHQLNLLSIRERTSFLPLKEVKTAENGPEQKRMTLNVMSVMFV